MIDFKKNVKAALPYNRDKYIEFLSDDVPTAAKWYGFSFQLPGGDEGKKIDVIKYVEVYGGLFRDVISKLDTGAYWIVNHDDKDLNWFPNDGDNLIHLRTLFRESKVPNTFKGALIFKKNDLLKCTIDLISYPHTVIPQVGRLYKNLDISHSKLPFIIKISGHLNIDFLSTNKYLLREIVTENSADTFIIKEYSRNALY